MSDSYLQTVREVCRDAALTPEGGLCCTTSPAWQLRGLSISAAMPVMNNFDAGGGYR